MANDTKAQMRKIRENLDTQGFDVSLVTNGHWNVKNMNSDSEFFGRSTQIAATPRYPRAVENCITRLKRIGYVHTRNDGSAKGKKKKEK